MLKASISKVNKDQIWGFEQLETRLIGKLSIFNSEFNHVLVSHHLKCKMLGPINRIWAIEMTNEARDFPRWIVICPMIVFQKPWVLEEGGWPAKAYLSGVPIHLCDDKSDSAARAGQMLMILRTEILFWYVLASWGWDTYHPVWRCNLVIRFGDRSSVTVRWKNWVKNGPNNAL